MAKNYGSTTETNQMLEEKIRNYTRNLFQTNPGSSNPQNFSCRITYLPSHKPSNWFYGISTIVDYLMPNPLYTYISNIYNLVWLGSMAYQPL